MVPPVPTDVGDDRHGLVGAASEAIATAGGTWLERRSARLAGFPPVGVPKANFVESATISSP